MALNDSSRKHSRRLFFLLLHNHSQIKKHQLLQSVQDILRNIKCCCWETQWSLYSLILGVHISSERKKYWIINLYSHTLFCLFLISVPLLNTSVWNQVRYTPYRRRHYLHSAETDRERRQVRNLCVCMSKTRQHLFIRVKSALVDSRGRSFECAGIKDQIKTHTLAVWSEHQEFTTALLFHKMCLFF